MAHKAFLTVGPGLNQGPEDHPALPFGSVVVDTAGVIVFFLNDQIVTDYPDTWESIKVKVRTTLQTNCPVHIDTYVFLPDKGLV